MANIIHCAFCNETYDIISYFTEDTLKKCKQILKHRKEHNLKFKDVILPNELSESGFHRQCYKSFTGLARKYYSPKSSSLLARQELSHAPEDLCSVFICNSQATEPQQILSNSSKTATTIIANPTTILEPAIITVNHSIPSYLQENNVNSETQNVICGYSIPIKSDECADSKNICIFCDRRGKKHRSKSQPMHLTDKNNMLAKLTQSENNLDLILKIENLPDSKVYYHSICQKNIYKKKLSNKELKSIWHDCRQYHQIAFKEMIAFIQENVIGKQQSYFLNYLHRYYIAVLETNDVDNIKNVIGNFTPNHLEDKIVKHFKKDVKFIIIQGKKLLASKDLTAIDDQYLEMLKQKDIIQKAALLLRKSILQEKRKNK